MAKFENVTVGLQVEYRIVFFPFATWIRLGDRAILTVCGMPVYRRIGDVRNICGVTLPRMRDNAS